MLTKYSRNIKSIDKKGKNVIINLKSTLKLAERCNLRYHLQTSEQRSIKHTEIRFH